MIYIKNTKKYFCKTVENKEGTGMPGGHDNFGKLSREGTCGYEKI
jgi:hypothetical protein